MNQKRTFSNFAEFYPFYLSEHQNLNCKRLHFLGTMGVIGVMIGAVVSRHAQLLLFLPIIGYGFAWIGHFVFEHNRPATFKYPFYSLISDWVMTWQILSGKISLFK